MLMCIVIHFQGKELPKFGIPFYFLQIYLQRAKDVIYYECKTRSCRNYEMKRKLLISISKIYIGKKLIWTWKVIKVYATNSLFISMCNLEGSPPAKNPRGLCGGCSPNFICSHVPMKIIFFYKTRKKPGNKKRVIYLRAYTLGCSSLGRTHSYGNLPYNKIQHNMHSHITQSSCITHISLLGFVWYLRELLGRMGLGSMKVCWQL